MHFLEWVQIDPLYKSVLYKELGKNATHFGPLYGGKTVVAHTSACVYVHMIEVEGVMSGCDRFSETAHFVDYKFVIEVFRGPRINIQHLPMTSESCGVCSQWSTSPC